MTRDLSAVNVRDFLDAAAREVPDDVFLLHGDDRITYRDFNERVDCAVGALHNPCALQGDHVAFPV